MKSKLHTGLLTILLVAYSQLILGNSFYVTEGNFNEKESSSFWNKHESNWKNIENFNQDSFWKQLSISRDAKKISASNFEAFNYFMGSFVGSTSNCDNNNVSSISVNVPSGAVNDLLIAAVSTDNADGVINTPSGWTLVQGALNSDTSLYVFYRLANGSEPNSYTFNLSSGSNEMCAAIVRYSGVNTTNPIQVSAIATGNSSTPNPPSITTSSNNAIIVNIIGTDDNESPMTHPSNTTERIDVESDQNSLGIADQNQTNAGSIDPSNWTISGGERWVAVTLAINTTPNIDPCDPIASGNLDTDGDGVADICDLDDDNDGILDTDESCQNSVLTTINTAPYPTNTNLTGSLPLTNIASGLISFNASLQGTASWADGVRINTNPVIGEHIYVQPTNASLGNGTATYTINFNQPVTNLSFVSAGLNNADFFEITAFLGNQQITINSSNFSNFDANQTWTVSNNRVTGLGSAGGTNVTENTFTTTIPGNIDRIVIRSGKNDGSTSTVTAAITTFIYCAELDSDKDGIPNSLDNDSDNDGCPDAIEGSATNITSANLDGNNRIIGGVNANGIPTLAATSATTGQANNASVTTAEQITVITAPANQTVNEGSNTSFSANASAKKTTVFNSGTPDYNSGTNTTVSYKWYKNSAPNTTLSTNSSLTLNNVTIGDAGDYSVLITGANNSCGEIRSASLTVNAVDPCTDGAIFGVVTANDPDADGINNVCDLDDDNDGILDSEECQTLIGEKAFFLDNPNDVETFNLPPVGNGFVLDVTSIDNSFNLTINGTPLISRTLSGGAITHELEFQSSGTLGKNVRFVSDQATYGTNGIQEIWQFDGINNTVVNAETPIIRVVVDENLNVTIYGSRTPNGPLEEMELFNGATFNNFTWNALTPNTFVVDQAEVGPTYIIGRVYGTFTDCDTDGDGINNNLDPDSDGDGCLDVVESGGIDANNDGKLDGTGIASNGKVTGGIGGYNGTNGNELFAHQMSVITQPVSLSVPNGQSASFSIVIEADEATSYNNGTPIYGTPGNANNGIEYQWFIGDPNNGGTPISNTGVYTGADSATLNISNVSGLGSTEYFIKATHSKKVCLIEIESATLSVNLPSSVNDTVSTNEDTLKNIDFLDNDTFGGDGPNTNNPITLSSGTTAQGGTVTLNDGGTPNDPNDDTFDYIPAANFNGTDTFDYT
ncbi:MAG: Ig-like domain-containing protein, partial [Polaribacter sp.]|nr:Ig-like domain-containing protein [Polaribacter sp.]